MSDTTGLRLGVDVGGTFTDLLLIDERAGTTHTAKVPSTPDDSSIGVLNGIERLCEQAGVTPGDIGEVMHGTTVATNTVLTRAGGDGRAGHDEGVSGHRCRSRAPTCRAGSAAGSSGTRRRPSPRSR